MTIDLGFPELIQRACWARERSGNGHRGGADAVLYSAMAVEAYPNDFALMASKFVPDDCVPKLVAARDLLPQFEEDRIQIQLKYQLLHFILSGQTFPKGEKIYQDFEFLIVLRNEIAHHKPSASEHRPYIQYPKRIAKIVEGLQRRKLLSREKHAFPSTWKTLLDDSDVIASWAVSVARNIVLYMNSKVPESPFKKIYIDPMSGRHSPMNYAPSK